MAELADQIDALREEIGYLEWGLGEREWPPRDHPRDDRERLAALRTALALLEALADRELLPQLLCCGAECRAADHELSADEYAHRYGCESYLVIRGAEKFLAALLACVGEVTS